MTHKLAVLFVCVHNAGRSRIAAGYLQAIAGDRISVLSTGADPVDQLNAVAPRRYQEAGVEARGCFLTPCLD